jgi:kynurenine formamidase
VGAVATGATAPVALAAGHGSGEDMTHTLHPNFPTYFGDQQFSIEQLSNYAEHPF